MVIRKKLIIFKINLLIILINLFFYSCSNNQIIDEIEINESKQIIDININNKNTIYIEYLDFVLKYV